MFVSNACRLHTWHHDVMLSHFFVQCHLIVKAMMAFYFSWTAQNMLKRRGKVRNGSLFQKKNYVCLADISRCCLIYSFKQVVRNSLTTFFIKKLECLYLWVYASTSVIFTVTHFQYLCKQGCSILVELHKNSNWFNIRSMFSSKPLYPIGGTMSCSLWRYMVCYYLATLFVLSLDSNTSGLLAAWYV